MRTRTLAMGLCLVAEWTAGCSATTRHRVLTVLFDGVPPLQGEGPSEAKPSPDGMQAARPQQPTLHEHGPYAARLCGACHDAAATNTLVAPRDRLCLRCHDRGPDKKYVHGPVASGECLVCHDPHSSAQRFLLVSEPDGVCLGCHEAGDVARIEAHAGAATGCTSCHDPHMSDRNHLLK